MSAIIDFFTGSLVHLLWPLIVAALGFFGVAIYGRKKKAEGHREGREEELERSRKAVKATEDEMEAEVKKPRTTKETKKRLEGGSF